jgi:hypothetical protein
VGGRCRSSIRTLGCHWRRSTPAAAAASKRSRQPAQQGGPEAVHAGLAEQGAQRRRPPCAAAGRRHTEWVSAREMGAPQTEAVCDTEEV